MNQSVKIKPQHVFRQVSIIGTGLLGASLGLALKAQSLTPKVVGIGRRKQTIDAALSSGCIDEATTDLIEGIASSDLIIIATPVSTIRSFLKKIAEHKDVLRYPNELIVTDVGSTKKTICDDAQDILGTVAINFVGAHPMAGGEKQGPDFADADLFSGAPCVVTTHEKMDPLALEKIKSLWSSFGSLVHVMDAATHDDVVARISHLPHIAAAAMVHLADQHHDWHLASTGFKDTSRVASGQPAIWRDILLNNKPAIRDNLDALIEEMKVLRQCLDQEDGQAIQTWFEKAKLARDAWINSRGK